jgi:hypothetical protein
MRSSGERLQEILIRYKEDEITRADALMDILRVLRSSCEGCKVREELKAMQKKGDNNG